MFFSSVSAVACACLMSAAVAANPCTNGSFEELGPQGFPTDWMPVGSLAEVSTDAHSGTRSVRMVRTADKTGRLYMVSQTRRWDARHEALRRAAEFYERAYRQISRQMEDLPDPYPALNWIHLQFLANKMVNRSRDTAKRIEVDMEQYRKRREQSLRSMAVRLGQKVKKKRKPITIEAMNAHDRRIVHLTLKNDRALETKSVGKGEMRKLVIHPVNGGRSKRHEASGAAS